MRKADKAGKLNGRGIKEVFESYKDWPGLKEFGGQLVTITQQTIGIPPSLGSEGSLKGNLKQSGKLT